MEKEVERRVVISQQISILRTTYTHYVITKQVYHLNVLLVKHNGLVI